MKFIGSRSAGLEIGKHVRPGEHAVEDRVILLLVNRDSSWDGKDRAVTLASTGGGDPGDAVGVHDNPPHLDSGISGRKALGGEVPLGERCLPSVYQREPHPSRL